MGKFTARQVADLYEAPPWLIVDSGIKRTRRERLWFWLLPVRKVARPFL